jgi:flagellar motor switch/type III secretory pathway protein FliN
MGDNEVQVDGRRASDPWGVLVDLPCELAIILEMPQIRVANLIGIAAGDVLSTQWQINSDLPLRVNGQLLGWAEFETARENMAVRLTEFTWEQRR